MIVAKGATPRTANHALGVLSAALTAAVEAGRLPANPAHGVRPVPEPNRAAELRERDRAENAGRRCRQCAIASPYRCFSYGGLRPSELLALKWVAVGEHVLLVERSYS